MFVYTHVVWIIVAFVPISKEHAVSHAALNTRTDNDIHMLSFAEGECAAECQATPLTSKTSPEK
jgi:hypothetical protein